MSYKIYTSGNYFTIETSKGEIYTDHAKEVMVKPERTNDGDTVFWIHNVEGFRGNPVKVSDMTDKNGQAYTLKSFQDFYETSTGKSSAGSSAGTTFTTDESLYLDEYDVLRANVSLYTQEWLYSGSGAFTFDFEPTNIVNVFIVRGQQALLADYTFTSPDSLTINDSLQEGDKILTNYEHFINQL